MTKKSVKRIKWEAEQIEIISEPIKADLYEKYIDEITEFIYEYIIQQNLDSPQTMEVNHG